MFGNIVRITCMRNRYSPLRCATPIKCFNKSPQLLVPCENSMVNARKQYSQDVQTMNTVDFHQVEEATKNNKVFIVDVREPDEVKDYGKIPNSINIPLGNVQTAFSVSEKEFSKQYNRPKPSENDEIIFYCMIGKRSGKAQQEAISLGYKNTKNYLGSWNDWAKNVQ